MRSLDNGQEHSYQLSLSAGQYAAIGVMQQGVDVQVQVFALHGKQVTEYDGAWETNGEESIEFVAATSGQYLLKVSMTRQQMAGNYEIQLKALRVADAKDKSLEEVQVLKRTANALSREAKHKEALTLYEQSLTIIEREMGNDNLEYAAILSKISDELMRLGEFAKAEQICLRSIALYKKFLREGNLETTNVLRTLGNIYFRTNDYSKSERAFQETLAIFEKSLGQENPKIVGILGDFAMVLVNKGDYVTAENHLLRGLAIVEKSASSNSNSLSTIVGNLGYLYVTKGEFARAEPYVRRGLAIREKQLGPDNPANAEDLENLAIILKEKKEYAEALQVAQRAAALKEKIVGADHIYLVAILNNVANIYKAQGEYEKACEAYLRILQIAGKSGGPNHRTTMTIVGNLANVYVAKGDIVNALNYQTRVDAVIENNIVMNLTLGSERQKLAYLDLMSPRTERTITFSVGLGVQEKEAKALAALVVLQRKGRALDAMANGLVKLRQRSNAEDQILLDRLNNVASQIARLTLNGPQKIFIEEHQQKIKTLEEQKEKLEGDISQRNTELPRRRL